MRKKNYTKVIAILTLVAVLALSAPSTFAASRYENIDFSKFLRRPFAFFAHLFTFVPVVNVAKYTFMRGDNSTDTGRFRITGDLVSGRLSKGD